MYIYLLGAGIALISLVTIVTLKLLHSRNKDLQESNERLRELVRSMANGEHEEGGVEE